MTDQSSITDEARTTAKGSGGSGRTRRSRRQLLAGGSGALAAVLTAEALARAAPAGAANGDPVVLGQNNAETSVTTIANSTADSTALRCTATGFGNAIEGSNDSGNAVFAISNSGTGVAALSSSSTAIVAESGSGTGVVGHSTSGTGVSGQSTEGEGVSGESGGSGAAVHGTNTASGTGVFGESSAGTGVLAAGKTALK